MQKIAAFLFATVVSLVFVACGSSVDVGDDPCTADSDCGPVTCCHAKACGAKSPKACDVACTLDCEGGTIDCGGGCFCDSGKCAAHLMP